MDMAEIRVGTSGWHYKHWLGKFYPEKLRPAEMLAFYCRHFDSVEINNSFYRLPKPGMFASWREATPKNFLFAVKGSRFITHNKKLKDPENALDNLIPRALELGKKLGPILWQLPPQWRVNLERLEEFLRALPRDLRFTFEFREPSWLTEEVYRILERYNAAFCIYDLARFHSPILTTADFAYVRLHGPGDKYQGSYSDAQLEQWARQAESWYALGKDVYIYFDNDQAAYAAHNAVTLKNLLGASTRDIPVAA
jgi:uncharacterized protein YecE (DUF72 family)